jgi:hypothetical protein
MVSLGAFHRSAREGTPNGHGRLQGGIHKLDPAVAFVEMNELRGKEIFVCRPEVGIRGVALDEDDVLTVFDQVIDRRGRHHRFADTSFASTDPIDSRSVPFDAESLIHGSFLRVWWPRRRSRSKDGRRSVASIQRSGVSGRTANDPRGVVSESTGLDVDVVAMPA